MELTISSDLITKFSKKLRASGEKALAVQVSENFTKYRSDESDIPIALIEDHLDMLHALAKTEGDRGLMMQITGYKSVMGGSSTIKITGKNLHYMPAALAKWVSDDIIKGWLFKKSIDGNFLPWLVIESAYHPRNDRTEMGRHVEIKLIANQSKGETGEKGTVRIIIEAGDVVGGKGISEILSKDGYFKETSEFHQLYDDHLKLFREFRPMFGKQFVAASSVIDGEDRWRREVITLDRPIKVINDDDLMKRKVRDEASVKLYDRKNIAIPFEERETVVREVPFHCYVYCFALKRHDNVWVHVSNLSVYRYKSDIRDQLILPSDQTELIDILVEDVEVMAQADIIEGKSEGTMIISRGEPGLGKTLTAEVYSEVVERPLYTIPAGLLGIAPDEVEENLKIVLERAHRWGAIPLIDEADVYIRRRGDDLRHNAVVAVWLRVTEYAQGILFLTTNRTEDIDDAILSRAAAIITYKMPSKGDALKMWKLHTARLLTGKFKVSAKFLTELNNHFGGISGRDIQRVVALVARVCNSKKEKPTLNLFIKAAVFKGLRESL